jgi:hypothetical protein
MKFMRFGTFQCQLPEMTELADLINNKLRIDMGPLTKAKGVHSKQEVWVGRSSRGSQNANTSI